MTGLERELLAMRDAVVWPETPDAAAAARARLASTPQRPRLAVRVRVAIAALVVAAGVGVAVSPAGASLLRWIGIGPTIRVTELERLPLPRNPLASGLGRPVTLAQARVLADFPLRVPGAPRRVRFSSAILGGAVTLEYRDATITQFAGSGTGFLQKLVAPPARATRERVNGVPGVFVSGGPTKLLATDREGQTVEIGGVTTPGTNVLLWDQGKVAFRLQTRRDLAAALALARRLR